MDWKPYDRAMVKPQTMNVLKKKGIFDYGKPTSNYNVNTRKSGAPTSLDELSNDEMRWIHFYYLPQLETDPPDPRFHSSIKLPQNTTGYEQRRKTMLQNMPGIDKLAQLFGSVPSDESKKTFKEWTVKIKIENIETQKRDKHLEDLKAAEKERKKQTVLDKLERQSVDAENRKRALEGQSGQSGSPSSVARVSATAAVALGALEIPSADEQELCYVWKMPGMEDYEASLRAKGSYLSRDLARKWIIENNMVPSFLGDDWCVCHIFPEKWCCINHSKVYFLAPNFVNSHFGEWLPKEWKAYVGNAAWETAELLVMWITHKTLGQRIVAMGEYDDEMAKNVRRALGKKKFVTDDAKKHKSECFEASSSSSS